MKSDQSAAPQLAPSTPSVILALLSRDLLVLRKQAKVFIIRTAMQPLLLMFVFTYVFPKIGQGIGGSTRSATGFSTLLVAGVLGISIIFQGIQAVALPLVQEFGFSKEIEDRVLAPAPNWAIAIEKILSGALQACLAAIVVFPIALIVPATPIHLQVNYVAIVLFVPLTGLVSGALGLTIGTLVPPTQIPLIFAIIVLPITFLGAVYYPWAALTPIPWLKYLILGNPLVYIDEGLRAFLTTGIVHMNTAAIIVGSLAFLALLTTAGIRGFTKRIVS